MSEHICQRIARSLSGQPIWMEPGAFRIAIEGIAPRLGLIRPDAQAEPGTFAAKKREAMLERLATIVEAEPVDVGNGMGEYGLTATGIAVMPIVGTLISRYDWLAALCGFASYDTIKLTLDAAMADPRVKGVLLDVDSPGGEAAGMLDLADRIRAASATKPVWASANSLAASAGYGLAAAADRLTLPRLATVGSVGVVGIHIDQSGYDKEMGLRYTPIYSGARKIDGWGHAPVSAEAKAEFQARFDESRRKFADAVAGLRDMDARAVLDTEAGIYDDDAAVAVGFADAVRSFDETLAELTDKIATGTSSSNLMPGARSTTTTKEGQMAKQIKAAATAAETDQPKTEPEKPAEETAKAAPAEPEKPDEGKGEEEGKTAAQVSRADAAAIAAYCAENGAPSLAAEMIRSGATMEQVKAKVGVAAKIREKAALAPKLGFDKAGQEQVAKMAEDYIKADKTPEQFAAAVMDKLAKEQSPEVRSAIATDQPGGHDHGWGAAFAKANGHPGARQTK